MTFYADGAAARDAGYRPCLRCRPDEVGRDRVAVARAIDLIAAAEEPPSLDSLAQAVGYAPHHFHRLFKRATGITPAAYARKLRAERAADALAGEGRVTDAIYEAGFSGPSGFYSEADARLGMRPSAWKKGGQGVRIRWTVAQTRLGPMLIAASDRGLCRISFDEGEADLRARFPQAEIVPADAAFAAMACDVVSLVDAPGRHLDLPVDVQGTAFQEAVWQALRAIPSGETRSYGELAAMIGRPKAVRAVGSACGANGLALLIPCHRALHTGGGLGGYAYGLDRKKALLAAEAGKK